jgi:DNA-directed RNA polymerase specialized sigma24 family protein
VDIPRLPEAEFTVDGKRYGVFGRDWREIPATLWLARLAEKETHTSEASPQTEAAPASRPQPSEPALVVLSEAEFQSAVRDALRDYTSDTALRRNPLVRSPLVASRAGASADVNARLTALRTLLNDTAQAFNATPRLARAYRALHHTYFQPCTTQEQAAELLDLPFSTYRRHLGEGITELSRALWQKETGDTA